MKESDPILLNDQAHRRSGGDTADGAVSSAPLYAAWQHPSRIPGYESTSRRWQFRKCGTHPDRAPIYPSRRLQLQLYAGLSCGRLVSVRRPDQ